MNILVEILHPAHVHFFRNAIDHWRRRGDEVLVLSREKECANALLRHYGIPYESISALGTSKVGLLFEMLLRDWRMWRACRKFKPDVMMGIMGVTIAQVGKLNRRPAIVFYDTENAAITNRFVYPLAHSVCTPDCYQGPVNGRHIKYPGYHELAYLHPARFKPDPQVLRDNGLDPGQPFFILRLVSWQASHDIGEEGLNTEAIGRLVSRLEKHGRVLISSEKDLPDKLAGNQFKCEPSTMHHFLAFAQMLIGESATMASEAAVLGTPAFFISDTGRGYTTEQEDRYGMVFNFKRHERQRIFDKLDELLEQPDMRRHFHENHRRLLDDKIDTTAWMIDFVDKVAEP